MLKIKKSMKVTPPRQTCAPSKGRRRGAVAPHLLLQLTRGALRAAVGAHKLPPSAQTGRAIERYLDIRGDIGGSGSSPAPELPGGAGPGAAAPGRIRAKARPPEPGSEAKAAPRARRSC